MAFEPTVLFVLVLVSGASGFAAYCISCAAHVWRSRNRSTPARGKASRLATPSVVVLVLGLAAVAIAFVSSAALEKKGRLVGEGLFILRLPAHLELDHLTRAEFIEAGEELAVFRSAEKQAEIEVLELRRRSLEAEKRIISSRPLEPARETARRLQQLATEGRHLRYAIDQLAIERQRLGREELRDGLRRRDEMRKLEGEIARMESEIEQTASRLRLARQNLKRSRSLLEAELVSQDEHDALSSEVEILEAEVAEIETRQKNLERERAGVDRALEEIDSLTAQQTADLDGQIAGLRARLAGLGSAKEKVEELAEADLRREEARRAERLAQLEIELRQCAARLAGLRESLVVRAPFPGRVAFRDSSIDMAGRESPLLVLTPSDGLRARLRLSIAEARALAAEDTVTFETGGESRAHRFRGRLLETRALEEMPGSCEVDLVCDPPPEEVRDLSNDRVVETTLRWRPPPTAFPTFAPGILLCLIGGLGRAASRWTGRSGDRDVRGTKTPPPGKKASRRSNRASAAASPSKARPRPGAAVNGGTNGSAAKNGREAAAESGKAGVVLQTLGSQLRESVLGGTVDSDLLSAIEWALDRHHRRAVRLLRRGLGDDQELCDRLTRLGGLDSPDHTERRLQKVLRTVAPDLAEPSFLILDPFAEEDREATGNATSRRRRRAPGPST